MEKLKFKLDEGAKAPTRAHKGDAGLDLYVKSREYDVQDQLWVYHTGVHVAIKEGYFGLLCARSSICHYDLILVNGVGVDDRIYRGELIAKFMPRGKGARLYNVGDKFCQLVILPYLEVEPEQCEELDETDRGETGFGGSGR